MSLMWPFDSLDPKSELVIPYFDYLHNIGLRARAILHDRSSNEIVLAAQIVILMLEGYYEGSALSTSSPLPRFLVRPIQKLGPDDPGHGLINSFVEELPKDGFESIGFEKEVSYLKENIDSFVFDEPGFRNPRQEELFCAYSLLCIQLCMEELEPIKMFATPGEGRPTKEITPEIIVSIFTRAGEQALMAMEAICCAEQLLEAGGLIAGRGRVNGGENIELKLGDEALARAAHQALSRKGGNARAAGYAPIKQQAIEYYKKYRKDYRSESRMIRQMIKDFRWHDIAPSTIERCLREYRQGKWSPDKK